MTGSPIFRVSPEVFEQFPDYIVGCVFARGITADPRHAISDLLDSAEVRARASYSDIDLKSEVPFAVWRDAFSTAGWSASRFPASVEALHKRIQRGDNAPRIITAVDLANAAVLYYSVPVGTHDTATFGGSPLEVRWSNFDDTFTDMGGRTESDILGEIIYAVGNDIRTRRWVWRQGRNGLIAPGAVDIFYPVDGFEGRTSGYVAAAVNFLAETCASILGAQVTTSLVYAGLPEFTADPE